MMRFADRRPPLPLLAVLEPALHQLSASELELFGSWPHRPRIVVDRMVLAREGWCFAPSALPFLELDDPAARFASIRRWRAEQGLPRWLFLGIPEETKPLFVDLASPIYAELLVQLAKKASLVRLREMLPCFDQLVLPDAAGALFTSELRLQITDPIPYPEEPSGPAAT
jgi:hypothetical protein